MKKVLQISILVILTIFCTVIVGHAACSGSSPNLTSASCSYSDVKDCVDIMQRGDAINVPSGTWSLDDSGATSGNYVRIE